MATINSRCSFSIFMINCWFGGIASQRLPIMSPLVRKRQPWFSSSNKWVLDSVHMIHWLKHVTRLKRPCITPFLWALRLTVVSWSFILNKLHCHWENEVIDQNTQKCLLHKTNKKVLISHSWQFAHCWFCIRDHGGTPMNENRTHAQALIHVEYANAFNCSGIRSRIVDQTLCYLLRKNLKLISKRTLLHCWAQKLRQYLTYCYTAPELLWMEQISLIIYPDSLQSFVVIHFPEIWSWSCELIRIRLISSISPKCLYKRDFIYFLGNAG